MNGDSPKMNGDCPKIDCDSPKMNSDHPKIDCDHPKMNGDTPKMNSDHPKIDGDSPKMNGDSPKIDCDSPKMNSDHPKIDCDTPKMNSDQTIKEMMMTYPNLYVDCAHSLYNQNWWSSLKVQLSTDPFLREHFLFANGFYMLEVDGTEKQCDIDFRAFIGEELFQQIAVTNPKRFMNVM